MSDYACCSHCSMQHSTRFEGHATPCSATCPGSVKIPSNPPSSPVEATAGLLGHCPACHSPMYGPCGTCISKANASGTPFEVKRLMELVCDREDTIIERDASIARLTIRLAEDDRDARIEALIGEGERLKDLVADLQTGLSDAITEVARLEKVTVERDATIERMGKVAADAFDLLIKERDAARDQVNQLIYDRNHPYGEVVLGTCPDSCGGQSWTGVDQAEGPGKVWRCDTCGRIVSQHVSNPIQAADDRRAL